MSFPVLLIAIMGILSTAALLLAYYVFVIKCCLNLNNRPPDYPHILRRLTRSRRHQLHTRHTPLSLLKGLNPATIRSLPTFRYSPATSFAVSASECAICLIEFRNEDPLRLLPDCAHAFHLDCIDVWLQSNGNCPLCRAFIKSRSFPAPSEEGVVVVDIKDEASAAARRIAGKSMGDECVELRREKEDVFAVQPMRRSLSMDSSSDGHLCLSVQEILRRNPDLFVLQERTGEGSSNVGRGSGRIRRPFFSFGRSRSSMSAVLPVQMDV
ncbi:hypothetical protein HPP92_025701 [Vanilla planifolia]|uniref:RING-type E3 ubiquitin transferase n=1 Tax=Vanilla planifolia TaxID=51239 RepID=A0A835PMT0_VANPL|nr:hypothetical protein HPP92_025701 [Vanilla planifolia]